MSKIKKKTIAVDFDKTLAIRNSGDSVFRCGPPIEAMVDRVKGWLAEGHKVIILTARSGEAQVRPVKKFLQDNALGDLEVTNIKTSRMDVFIDDRAKEVIPNTGQFAVELLHIELAKAVEIIELLKNKLLKHGFSDSDNRTIDEWILRNKGEVGKDEI